MKSVILIAVLAALSVCYAASVPDGVSVYEAGSIGRSGEFVLHEQSYFRDSNGNNSVAFDINYLGNATVRITGVRINFPPQYPGSFDFGVLGNSFITVRLVTAPGRDLGSSVTLYGRVV